MSVTEIQKDERFKKSWLFCLCAGGSFVLPGLVHSDSRVVDIIVLASIEYVILVYTAFLHKNRSVFYPILVVTCLFNMLLGRIFFVFHHL